MIPSDEAVEENVRRSEVHTHSRRLYSLNIALMGISRLFLSVFRITCVCDCDGGAGAAESAADGITGDRFTRIISAKGLTTICEATIAESICPAASQTIEGVGVPYVHSLQTAIDPPL